MQDPKNTVVIEEGSWWNREGMNEVGWMRNFFKQIGGNESSQGVIKYVLVLLLIAFAIRITLTVLATGVTSP